MLEPGNPHIKVKVLTFLSHFTFFTTMIFPIPKTLEQSPIGLDLHSVTKFYIPWIGFFFSNVRCMLDLARTSATVNYPSTPMPLVVFKLIWPFRSRLMFDSFFSITKSLDSMLARIVGYCRSKSHIHFDKHQPLFNPDQIHRVNNALN